MRAAEFVKSSSSQRPPRTHDSSSVEPGIEPGEICFLPLRRVKFLQGPQELLLTSSRTSGELLVVRFVRAGRRQAEIHVLVRDTKGRTFTTPDIGDKHFPLDISHGNKFQVASRLHVSSSIKGDAPLNHTEFSHFHLSRLEVCGCNAWNLCESGG